MSEEWPSLPIGERTFRRPEETQLDIIEYTRSYQHEARQDKRLEDFRQKQEMKKPWTAEEIALQAKLDAELAAMKAALAPVEKPPAPG